jgi:hypothetical protein
MVLYVCINTLNVSCISHIIYTFNIMSFNPNCEWYIADFQVTSDWNGGILYQLSPTNGPRENFGGPWRNLDIICNFYVYYTVSLYSDSNITLILLL